jgi:hypothetical protein
MKEVVFSHSRFVGLPFNRTCSVVIPDPRRSAEVDAVRHEASNR